jgi:ribosomal protein S6E (S10)
VDLCPFEKLRGVLDGLEAQITDQRGKRSEEEEPGSSPEKNAKRKIRDEEPGQQVKQQKEDLGTCQTEVQGGKERGGKATEVSREDGGVMPRATHEQVKARAWISYQDLKIDPISDLIHH